VTVQAIPGRFAPGHPVMLVGHGAPDYGVMAARTDRIAFFSQQIPVFRPVSPVAIGTGKPRCPHRVPARRKKCRQKFNMTPGTPVNSQQSRLHGPMGPVTGLTLTGLDRLMTKRFQHFFPDLGMTFITGYWQVIIQQRLPIVSMGVVAVCTVLCAERTMPVGHCQVQNMLYMTCGTETPRIHTGHSGVLRSMRAVAGCALTLGKRLMLAVHPAHFLL